MRGKTGIMFLSGKPFSLSRGDDFSITNQGGGAVVVEG
jgi:hypothetical protein